MSFREYFNEEMEEKEVEEEFDPKEIELGMEDEAVHKELYNKFKVWADENKLELPMTEEEFLMDIVTEHLRLNPTEYTDALKCKEGEEVVEESKEPIDYLTFRSHAIQGLSQVSEKQKKQMGYNTWSKDDLENWVRKEYERHYGKKVEEAVSPEATKLVNSWKKKPKK